MPIEVVTKDEVEKLVRKLLVELLDESSLSKRVSELEASITDLQSRLTEAPTSKTTPQALISDLGGRTGLLHIDLEGDPITLRPKRWLRSDDFRIIAEVIRRHGGVWSPSRRAFIHTK